MMPFLPASGGIPQPTIAQCAPFSFTSNISGGADGAAGGVKEWLMNNRSILFYKIPGDVVMQYVHYKHASLYKIIMHSSEAQWHNIIFLRIIVYIHRLKTRVYTSKKALVAVNMSFQSITSSIIFDNTLPASIQSSLVTSHLYTFINTLLSKNNQIPCTSSIMPDASRHHVLQASAQNSYCTILV